MASITVIGLGSGDMDQLTLGVWRTIREVGKIYVRTVDHPVVAQLRDEGIQLVAYDAIYEQSEDFPEVYERIVAHLLNEAQKSEETIVYAVPGHPSVAEASVKLLKQQCEERQLPLRLMGGESFLDQAFLRLGLDPVEGFTLLDASRLNPAQLQPELHTIITQIYDTFTASDAKLALLECFPPEYEVVVARELGISGKESIEWIQLVDLDRQQQYGNHVMVWVPRSDEETLRNRSFERLREIVEILRSPDGCPWDREQTHQSLRKNLIEETCEVLETIDEDDPEAMCEELGDLLLQVMLHAQIEAETGVFTVADVIQTLNEKLLRRHPHVFGERHAESAGEALMHWEQIKAAEKQARGLDPDAVNSILDGVPPALPGMMKAWQYQKRAAKVGFDWEQVDAAFAKLQEEIVELKEVTIDRKGEQMHNLEERRRDELGDVLFSVVNVARFLQLDPEEAMAQANLKFYRRFQYMEQQVALAGNDLKSVSLEDLEKLWQESKDKVG